MKKAKKFFNLENQWCTNGQKVLLFDDDKIMDYNKSAVDTTLMEMDFDVENLDEENQEIYDFLCFTELGEKFYTIMKLRDFGCTFKEIADVLGISARNNVYRTLQTIDNKLERVKKKFIEYKKTENKLAQYKQNIMEAQRDAKPDYYVYNDDNNM